MAGSRDDVIEGALGSAARVLPSVATMATARAITISDETDVELDIAGRRVKLTNLDKKFWSSPVITKRQLLQYYADVSPYLIPHLRDRAMVMKRYPMARAASAFS